MIKIKPIVLTFAIATLVLTLFAQPTTAIETPAITKSVPSWIDEVLNPKVREIPNSRWQVSSWEIIWSHPQDKTEESEEISNIKFAWKPASSKKWSKWKNIGFTNVVKFKPPLWKIGNTYDYKFQLLSTHEVYESKVYSFTTKSYSGDGSARSPFLSGHFYRWSGIGGDQQIRFDNAEFGVERQICRDYWRYMRLSLSMWNYCEKKQPEGKKLFKVNFTYKCSWSNYRSCSPDSSRPIFFLCTKSEVTSGKCDPDGWFQNIHEVPGKRFLFLSLYWFFSMEGYEAQVSQGDSITFTEVFYYPRMPKSKELTRVCIELEQSIETNEWEPCFVLSY